METNAPTTSSGGVAEKISKPADRSARLFLALMSQHTSLDRNLSSGSPNRFGSSNLPKTPSWGNQPPWSKMSSQKPKSPSSVSYSHPQSSNGTSVNKTDLMSSPHTPTPKLSNFTNHSLQSFILPVKVTGFPIPLVSTRDKAK
eukprot:4341801-Amphidinium_carterae.1